MLKLRVGDELKAQGKTAYWLAEHAGLTMPAAYRLAGNSVRRIDLATLDKVCAALGVKPADLLDYKPKRGVRGAA